MTITLTREEAQQVFHALKSCSGVPHWPALIPVIETLRTRLAQPEPEQRTGDCLLTGVCAAEGHRIQKAQPEPEPVAWSVTLEGDHIGNFYIKQQDAEEAMHDLNKDWPQWVRKAVPLYTAPPQREWQGLTDEEETELIKKWAGELVFEVTQALKEKNT